MRRILASIFMLAALFMVSANRIIAQTRMATQSEAPAPHWRLAFLRYHERRIGYDSLPIQVVNVSGGKLGPAEKFKILVSGLKNRLPQAVKAVKFNWYLFNIKDMNEGVETGQTPLVEVNLAPYEKREFKIFIVYLEDIPLLRNKTLDEEFRLEVAVTEIQYEDVTLWQATDLPAKLDCMTSLSFSLAAQGTPPITCRGKSLPITLLPGPEMSGPSLPLRFGGTRPFPRPPVNIFRSENALRLVIKSRDEFSNFWKQLISQVPPANWAPPPPEIDFSKEMIVVAAMGARPTSGYWAFIDGACEVDGRVEVFVSNVEDASCLATMQVQTYPADAVRLPQTDLPVVFRETQIACTLKYPRGVRPD